MGNQLSELQSVCERARKNDLDLTVCTTENMVPFGNGECYTLGEALLNNTVVQALDLDLSEITELHNHDRSAKSTGNPSGQERNPTQSLKIPTRAGIPKRVLRRRARHSSAPPPPPEERSPSSSSASSHIPADGGIERIESDNDEGDNNNNQEESRAWPRFSMAPILFPFPIMVSRGRTEGGGQYVRAVHFIPPNALAQLNGEHFSGDSEGDNNNSNGENPSLEAESDNQQERQREENHADFNEGNLSEAKEQAETQVKVESDAMNNDDKSKERQDSTAACPTVATIAAATETTTVAMEHYDAVRKERVPPILSFIETSPCLRRLNLKGKFKDCGYDFQHGDRAGKVPNKKKKDMVMKRFIQAVAKQPSLRELVLEHTTLGSYHDHLLQLLQTRYPDEDDIEEERLFLEEIDSNNNHKKPKAKAKPATSSKKEAPAVAVTRSKRQSAGRLKDDGSGYCKQQGRKTKSEKMEPSKKLQAGADQDKPLSQTKLETLHVVYGSRLRTKAEMNSFRSMIALNTTLKKVELTGLSSRATWDALFRGLQRNSSVTTLCIDGVQYVSAAGGIDSNTIRDVLESPISRIRNLYLTRCWDLDLEPMAAGLARNSTVTKLTLDRCGLEQGLHIESDDEDHDEDDEDGAIPKVGVDRQDAVFLKEVLQSPCSALVHLNVSCNRLRNEGFEELAKGLFRNRTLKTLNISDNMLRGLPAATILRDILRRNKSLSVLTLDHNELGDLSAVRIARPAINDEIGRLLDGRFADVVAAERTHSMFVLQVAIAHTLEVADMIVDGLSQNQTLEQIDFSACALGNAAVSLIVAAALNSSANLLGQPKRPGVARGRNKSVSRCSCFGLDSNGMGAEGVRMMVEEMEGAMKRHAELLDETKPISLPGYALKKNHLSFVTVLSLNGNRLLDEGACLLANILEQDRVLPTGRTVKSGYPLEQLALNDTGMGDEALMRFCKALETNTTLQILSMEDNRFGLPGLLVLSESVKKFKGLMNLEISSNGALVLAMPKLLEGLEQNTTLCRLHLTGWDSNVNKEWDSKLVYFQIRNSCIPLLSSSPPETHIPVALWPNILGYSSRRYQTSALFFVLREKLDFLLQNSNTPWNSNNQKRKDPPTAIAMDTASLPMSPLKKRRAATSESP